MSEEKFSVETKIRSPRVIGRALLLFLLPITAYVLGLLPIILFYHYSIIYIPFTGVIYFASLAVILVFCFIFFIVFETLIPGLFIRIFRIKV